VDLAWRITDQITSFWKESKIKILPTYKAGTWGPKEADMMMRNDGKAWFNM
jgi:glucose-6-phosphate 1-dehydrogenase